MTSLIIFILILSVLVLIHEFGHYIIARKNGILVEEFGMGIPPRLYGKRFGETIYSLNLFPFGGFVRLKGEDTEEITPSDLKDPRSFISKTPLQRIAVIMAGVVMNIIFGAALFYISLGFNGFKSDLLPLIFPHDFAFGNVQKTDTAIFGLDDNSPLKTAEIPVELGDTLVSIGGVNVKSLYDVRALVEDKTDQEVTIVIKPRTSSETRELVVKPYTDSEEPGSPARLGVYLGSTAQIFYDTPSQKAFSGFLHSYNILNYSVATMGKLVGLSIEKQTAEPLAETVSGPIGIYSIVDDIVTYSGKEAFLSLINLMALISVSLAFLNILPLPALDGGRIFFILIELISKRKVNPRIEARVHQVGMLVLLCLLVLVTIRDVGRIF